MIITPAMSHFDVFNGDADGMCALHQLRLAEPRAAVRITGLKREIALLGKVRAAAGDSVTVLDLSIDVNRGALDTLLARGVNIQYFDHHGSSVLPRHPLLDARIDRAHETCTGMIVDRYLRGRYRPWAIVAAFGDNFRRSARQLAHSINLTEAQVTTLQELGECLNYNAYGDTDADPVIHPASLYAILERHESPFEFIRKERIVGLLRESRQRDLALACGIAPYANHDGGSIHILPDAAWSRRVRGEFGNAIARREPTRAHAILVPNSQGGYTVSVRMPFDVQQGAHDICAHFNSGGGRAAAAGITHLPAADVQAFFRAFRKACSCLETGSESAHLNVARGVRLPVGRQQHAPEMRVRPKAG